MTSWKLIVRGLQDEKESHEIEIFGRPPTLCLIFDCSFLFTVLSRSPLPFSFPSTSSSRLPALFRRILFLPHSLSRPLSPPLSSLPSNAPPPSPPCSLYSSYCSSSYSFYYSSSDSFSCSSSGSSSCSSSDSFSCVFHILPLVLLLLPLCCSQYYTLLVTIFHIHGCNQK